MADSGISVTFDPETSHRLTRLAEVTKESVQELVKQLIEDGIECKIEEIALADVIKERDTPGAETIKYEDFKQG
ncbi:hypothetical protein [Wolbachia endosymbiont of Cimex lectularius]|uniref:hypothetical protein n=1 Tax=Wolbachia endosymbiont of Cimex lectularius TaxID=246273 RepID=UPI0005976184|nr:hypothetical protein [Wolbachia endosymbiont of Cimex lectularius]